MRRILVILVAASALAAAPVAAAQHTGQRPNPAGGGSSQPAGEAAKGGGSGQTTSRPSGGDDSGGSRQAVPRTERSEPNANSGDKGASTARKGEDGSTRDNGTSELGRRPSNGHPVTGQAVRREPGSSDGNGHGHGHGSTIIVPGYGYPWGYAGLGLGGYYGGYFDPWWYDDPGYYGGGYASSYSDNEGSLRMKVMPREAEVYVDGYFAGEVDDYDGVFQKLRLDPGPHRIELREEGYEPLFFDIRIQPDRTVTYKGTLLKAQ